MGATERDTVSSPIIDDLFDEDGFLRDPDIWTPELAARIGQLEGVQPLGDRHWQVIEYVREKFFRLGGPLAMRRVCRDTGLPRQEIHELFGSCLAIWRIAGLPHPGEEAKAYFG